MSFPKPFMKWEPHVEGVVIEFSRAKGAQCVRLPMESVHKLRDDMEEATMLARGFEKVETFVEDIEPGMLIRLLGDTYEVTNLLTHGEKQWTVQFVPHRYHEGFFELTLPHDLQVTAYRSTSQ